MEKVDYRSSLNLPKTDFPMKANLVQREPQQIADWDKNNIYEKMVDANKDGQLYSLHDGPPYANGRIHIGTAMNKVLKDIIVKYQNLSGRRSVYIPGWDCHGLPIELAAEKEMGGDKTALKPGDIRKKCRSFADKNIKVMTEDFKRLGVLGDWDNPYKTMDFGYEAQIIRELGHFAEKEVLYQGEMPVYWCSSCRTALAEAEVEHENHNTPAIFVRFKVTSNIWDVAPALKRKEQSDIYIVIWTTTPWTIPANLAIALHPDFDYVPIETDSGDVYIVAETLADEFVSKCGLKESHRGESFKGKILDKQAARHPFMERDSMVILADYVSDDSGTGCVHIAPGHGLEDYIACQPYGIEVYNPVNEVGEFDDTVPKWAGMNVWKANKPIMESMKDSGALVFSENIEHQYPHCWRCHNPIVFRATAQWFASLDSKAEIRTKTLEEIRKVEWIPKWGEERIFGMIQNRPDWVLSRQRHWGVPIAVLFCEDCEKPQISKTIMDLAAAEVEKAGIDAWYDLPVETFVPDGHSCSCGSKKFRKEKDILDVWFDSGVSHACVQEKREGLGSPCDLYIEGSDQHRGWFHTSLLTGMIGREYSPYKRVITHGFVNDAKGKKMSKSKGNVISPNDLAKKHGAEIFRMWVATVDFKSDVSFSEEAYKRVVEAYRKIRNTARYILGNISDFDPDKDRVDPSHRSELDLYILHRLNNLSKSITKAYAEFNFHLVYHQILNFCAVDLSSFYLDILKDRIYTSRKDAPERRAAQETCLTIIDSLVRLMAPVLSFTAEEIWGFLPGKRPQSVFMADLLDLESNNNEKLKMTWDTLLEVRQDVSRVLENLRKEKTIGHSLDSHVELSSSNENMLTLLKKYETELRSLFIVSKAEVVDKIDGDGVVKCESGLMVRVKKAAGEKCARCWIRNEGVGQDTRHPDTCPNCSLVLSS